MNRRFVTVATTTLLLAALALPGGAAAKGGGASDCQPAGGQRNAMLAHLLGGLGSVASVVAQSQPGAIAALTHVELFNCP